MNSAECDNFLVQFKSIGQSLKKRFFRKPNVADAIEQYENLCQTLYHQNQKEFAAVCSLEQAKCHESVQNPVGQASSLMRGAKYLIEACHTYEDFDVKGKEVPFGDMMGGRADGLTQVAVQSLEQCVKPYTGLGNHGLVLLVHMRIGEILSKNNYFDQALKYYEEALKIAEKHFALPDRLVIVDKIVNCKIKISELESASQIVTEYLDEVKKIPEDVAPRVLCDWFITRFEITRVCLVLVLGSDSADIVNFIWPEETNEEEDSGLDQDKTAYEHLKDVEACNSESRMITVLLKSLALAVQHGSVPEIQIVRTHLSPLLNETQQELFRILIQLQS